MGAEVTGTIFDVQRACMHDGPGLRTVIFLKGCPLRCRWCENPESLRPEPQLAYDRSRCVRCGACEKACRKGAAAVGGETPQDWARCDDCGDCANLCSSGARTVVGRRVTVAEVVKQVLRDRAFYVRSGGGATLSGGEPTAQLEFSLAVVGALRAAGIHVVLETSGFAPAGAFDALSGAVDLVYFDLKALRDEIHRQVTNVSHALVLENARRIVGGGKPVVFRVPLVPGMNTDEPSLDALAQFLDEVRAAEVHLLPYHKHGEGKLRLMRTPLTPLHCAALSRAEAGRLASRFATGGRRIVVGGG